MDDFLNKLSGLLDSTELIIINKLKLPEGVNNLIFLKLEDFKNSLYKRAIVAERFQYTETPVATLFNENIVLGTFNENEEMDSVFFRKSSFDESKKCCYVLDRNINGKTVRDFLVYIPT